MPGGTGAVELYVAERDSSLGRCMITFSYDTKEPRPRTLEDYYVPASFIYIVPWS